MFPFDLHFIDTKAMSEAKRRKIRINPKVLRNAQRCAIKIMIELKHIHGLDPTPLLAGKFFSRSLTSCALKKTQGRSNTKSLYNKHPGDWCPWR